MSNAALYKETLKMKRKGMTAKQRKKSKNFTPSTVWLYPWSKERKYARAITKLMKQITTETTKVIKKELPGWIDDYRTDELDVFKMDDFSSDLKKAIAELQAILDDIYGDESPQVRAFITGIGEEVSAFNYKQFQKFNKEFLGVEFVVTEPWEEAVIQEWSDTNFELIQNLSNEYIETVNTIVSNGVQTGESSSEIMKKILKKNKFMSEARARLIARDQVGKLNGELTKRRMGDAGIDMYEWLTAGDERVRGNPSGPFKNAIPSHYVMNRKLCRWDDDTVYSTDKGKTWKQRTSKMPRAIPGQEIQCRCTGLPFFMDIIEEVDEEIKMEEAA